MAKSNAQTDSQGRSSVKPSDTFDVVVIGGGIAGLLTACELERSGRKVALIEALDSLGGNSRAGTGALGAVDHGLKHFPNLEGSADLLHFVEEATGLSLSPELIDAPPVTYDSGRFEPFVGFGKETAEAAEEFENFASQGFWQLGATPKDWIPALAARFQGPIFLQSVVTKIKVDHSRVSEIVVNGSKVFAAADVIFCAPPGTLPALLSAEGASSSSRQKLRRGDAFTSICLDLVHGAVVSESRAPHILRGANEEPCVGLFHPAQRSEDGRLLQRSQWMALIAADQTDDSELVSQQLKYVKRQIKRVYETALDGLVGERILVCPSSHGSAAGFVGEDRLWPKTKNLYVVSSFFSERRGLLGMIDEVRSAVARLAKGLAFSEPSHEAQSEASL